MDVKIQVIEIILSLGSQDQWQHNSSWQLALNQHPAWTTVQPRRGGSTLQTDTDLPLPRHSRPWCAESEGWAHRQGH